jgi:acyl CoA:acetate/3-ketoacid CoA transferase beta subunit
MQCRAEEIMACRIAAEMSTPGVTVLGSFTPLAYAAAMLAKLTHTPDTYFAGFNALDVPPTQLSIAGFEAGVYRRARGHWTFSETTQTVHVGARGSVECISPAQLDGSGAINLSAIGSYDRPTVRLPGGAGSPEVAQHYRRVVIYLPTHDRRRLVSKVDFRTAQRSPIDAARRAELGLRPGSIIAITPLCVMVKDHDDEPFRLQSLSSGATVEEIVQRTGFEVIVPSAPEATAHPTLEQLRLLREHIDPHGVTRLEFMRGAERREHLRALLEEEWQRAAVAARARVS